MTTQTDQPTFDPKTVLADTFGLGGEIDHANYVRDFGTSPSINNPASAEEARLAILLSLFRTTTDASHVGHPLAKKYEANAYTNEQQAQWLEEARQNLLFQFGVFIGQQSTEIDRDAIRAARA